MTSLPPDFWNDAELSARIDDSIETHRKSNATLRVLNPSGQPQAGIAVSVEQIDSPFHFGANLFMLDGFPTEEQNQRYTEAFCALFNGATVPFYWKELEPEQDRLRFAADSPFIARRPPPDRVISFCQQHGLRMHGHTLVWNLRKYGIPSWLPNSINETVPLWKKRIEQIAQRYGATIPRWDVLNERCADYNGDRAQPMPENYERLAFQWAGEVFPKEALFDINEVTSAWCHLRDQYHELIQRLLQEGARIDGIGMQFHLFTDSELLELLSGKYFPATQLLETLDLFGKFQRPIHVSEITLTSREKSVEGLRDQARAAASLYRLWFSHPSVRGITWWNVPDGGAAPDENKVYSGLLDSDLKPKPSYEALHHLIQHEWRTTQSGATDSEGQFSFRGFHGTYRVRLQGNDPGQLLTVAPTNDLHEKNTLSIQLASS